MINLNVCLLHKSEIIKKKVHQLIKAPLKNVSKKEIDRDKIHVIRPIKSKYKINFARLLQKDIIIIFKEIRVINT